MVEGSVYLSGNRVRLAVQLCDAATADQIWADRFDKILVDFLSLQDEIISRLANQLQAELIEAEARRAEATSTPDSMDLYFQGRSWANKGMTPPILGGARAFFERAYAQDPRNIDALVALAHMDTLIGQNFSLADRAALMTAAEAALIQALSMAPNHIRAHLQLGFVEILTDRAEAGMAEFAYCLTRDPNMALAHAYVGSGKLVTGRAEEVDAHIDTALRLSPHDNRAFIWMFIAGVANFYARRYENAAAWARRSLEANRNLARSHFLLGIALARLGRTADTKAEIGAGLALDPDFTLRRFRVTAATSNPTYLAQFEHFVECLAEAGIPEG